MAGDSLIERYLAELDDRLASRRDRADLVDEVADHLHSAVERWEKTGADVSECERRALAQFGRPDIVAALISTTMPAESTKGVLFFARHLGTLSFAAAVLWLSVGAVSLYGRIRFHGFYWPDPMAGTAGLALALAVLATTAALVALNVRAIGGVDDSARAVALIGIVAGFLALTMAWLAPLWTSLFSLAVVWTLARTWRSRAGSRALTLAMIIVLPAVVASTIVLPIMGSVVGGIPSDPVVATVLACGVAVLVAGFSDIAVRTARRSASPRSLVA